VEIACSDEEMLEMLESVLRRAGTTRLDWDLEGRQLADEAGNARRSRVLAILQARHPDLHTTFTLTGHLNGLTPDSLHVLRSTLGAGVRIDRVSVMTMTFGAGNVRQLSPATMAQAAITSFLAAADQLALLFPERDRAQLHAMMGITPMLGANDDDTVFTLADAQALAAFVRASGIGWVSYWSFQRDRAQKTHGYKPLGDYSGVAQAAGQFHRILSGAAQP